MAGIKFFLLLTLWVIMLSLPNQLSGQATLDIIDSFTLPKQYIVYKTSTAPVIDGEIEEQAWDNALWTDYFVDIEGSRKPNPAFSTRTKITWDDAHLYIAAELEEPHIWATLTKHDQIIYYDNDFEVFIDPENNGHDYYEIEVNAFNTILDLFLAKPYRVGGQAMLHWDAPGFRSAVKIKGTVNNPQDKDEGWTVEMAIPFRSVSMGNHARIPKEGTLWRINFSRVQWDVEIVDGNYVKMKDDAGKFLPEHNWVWSPQGLVNMHFPERWGYLYFSEFATADASRAFTLPAEESQKQLLWLIYYKQKDYHQKHRRYANSLSALGIEALPAGYTGIEASLLNHISMEAGTYQFIAILTTENNKRWSINHEGLVSQIRE